MVRGLPAVGVADENCPLSFLLGAVHHHSSSTIARRWEPQQPQRGRLPRVTDGDRQGAHPVAVVSTLDPFPHAHRGRKSSTVVPSLPAVAAVGSNDMGANHACRRAVRLVAGTLGSARNVSRWVLHVRLLLRRGWRRNHHSDSTEVDDVCLSFLFATCLSKAALNHTSASLKVSHGRRYNATPVRGSANFQFAPIVTSHHR